MTNRDYVAAAREAVLKRALGYDAEEVVEEYSGEDGTLIKRKVTRKNVPPDMSAAKLLLAGEEKPLDVSQMTDEELAEEKRRLLALLKEENQNDGA